MKKEPEKEREIYAIGSPSFENLTQNEKKAFFGTLLCCVVEHFKENDNKNKTSKIVSSSRKHRSMYCFAILTKGEKKGII